MFGMCGPRVRGQCEARLVYDRPEVGLSRYERPDRLFHIAAPTA